MSDQSLPSSAELRHDMREELGRLREENASLRAQVGEGQEEIRQKNEEIAAHRATEERLYSGLAQAGTDVQIVREENAQLRAQVEGLREALGKLVRLANASYPEYAGMYRLREGILDNPHAPWLKREIGRCIADALAASPDTSAREQSAVEMVAEGGEG